MAKKGKGDYEKFMRYLEGVLEEVTELSLDVGSYEELADKIKEYIRRYVREKARKDAEKYAREKGLTPDEFRRYYEYLKEKYLNMYTKGSFKILQQVIPTTPEFLERIIDIAIGKQTSLLEGFLKRVVEKIDNVYKVLEDINKVRFLPEVEDDVKTAKRVLEIVKEGYERFRELKPRGVYEKYVELSRITVPPYMADEVGQLVGTLRDLLRISASRVIERLDAEITKLRLERVSIRDRLRRLSAEEVLARAMGRVRIARYIRSEMERLERRLEEISREIAEREREIRELKSLMRK